MSDASSNKVAIKSKLAWNPIAGALLVIGLYFIAPIIGSILLSPLAGGFISDATTTQFLFILIVELITVSALVYFLRKNKSSLADIGLGKPKPKHVAIGLAVYPLYFLAFVAVVVIGTQLLPGLDVDQEQQLGFDNVKGIVALALTFVSLVILPPFVEELTVRGMLFTSLRSKLSLVGATLLTSASFAAAHLPAGGAAGPLYIAAIDTFVLSIVLCYVREKTGSLWPCITLHALKNGIAYISLYILVIR